MKYHIQLQDPVACTIPITKNEAKIWKKQNPLVLKNVRAQIVLRENEQIITKATYKEGNHKATQS